MDGIEISPMLKPCLFQKKIFLKKNKEKLIIILYQLKPEKKPHKNKHIWVSNIRSNVHGRFISFNGQLYNVIKHGNHMREPSVVKVENQKAYDISRILFPVFETTIAVVFAHPLWSIVFNQHI